MEFKLLSPGGVECYVYHWPYGSSISCSKAAAASYINDMVHTMLLVCKEIDFPQVPYLQKIIANCGVADFESMRKVCCYYNKVVGDVLFSKQTYCLPPVLSLKSIGKDLLQHVLQQTYAEAVEFPEKLNNYIPFSSNVYGETSFDFIQQIIYAVKPTEKDTFLDLGSGIGQVVLQMAASSSCKASYGIEEAVIPSKCAIRMDAIFRKKMKWYGKHHNEYHLLEGNFLSPEFKTYFHEATIIFINNFSFGAKLDNSLALYFAGLKDETKIISAKPFAHPNFKITYHNLNHIGTVLNVEELVPNCKSVSWTSRPVPFFIQTIDRTKLEKFVSFNKAGKR